MRPVDKKELNKVRNVARKVRRAVEEIEKQEGWIYGDLCGYCARASAMVHSLLIAKGIESKICLGQGHAYVEWKGRVVDVTATQFSERFGKTVIRTRRDIKKIPEDTWDANRWEKYKQFKNIDNLKKYQLLKDWPENQIVNQQDIDCVMKRR